jgi:hypothetical protein
VDALFLGGFLALLAATLALVKGCAVLEHKK